MKQESESQCIEYKRVWNDEYLKWISGFANAQGGTLHLGKDDNGRLVGLTGWQRLINALAHKDYAGGSPVQISVYNDKIIFWNEGQLPDNWTADMFLAKHPSKPFNPDIANAFFRSGYIELWGRGIIKIVNECLRAGFPMPHIRCDMGGLFVELKKDILNQEQLEQIGLNNRQIKAILFAKAKGSITNKIYQQINAVSKRTATSDLSALTVHFKLLTKTGTHGAGIYYTLNRAKIGQIGQVPSN